MNSSRPRLISTKQKLAKNLAALTFMLLFCIGGVSAQWEDVKVRMIYIVPSNREKDPDYEQKMQTFALEAQAFYADQYERNGFGAKILPLELDPLTSLPIIHCLELATDPDYANCTDVYFQEEHHGLWDNKSVSVHRMTESWEEGESIGAMQISGATWNSPDDSDTTNIAVDGDSWTPGGEFLSSPTATNTSFPAGSKDVFAEFNVLSDVSAWLGGADNEGWIVKRTDELTSGLALFYSKESDLLDPSEAAYEGNQYAVAPQLVLQLTGGSGPPTETLSAVKDTYIRSQSPNRNHGAELYSQMYGERPGALNKGRTLIAFDQSEIAAKCAGRTLVGATLRLKVWHTGSLLAFFPGRSNAIVSRWFGDPPPGSRFVNLIRNDVEYTMEDHSYPGGGNAGIGGYGMGSFVTGNFNFNLAQPHLLVDDRPITDEAIEELLPELMTNGTAPRWTSGSTFSMVSSISYGVILHEFAHALGISHNWENSTDKSRVGHLSYAYLGNLMSYFLGGFRGWRHPDRYGLRSPEIYPGYPNGFPSDVRIAGSQIIFHKDNQVWNETDDSDNTPPTLNVVSNAFNPKLGLTEIVISASDAQGLSSVWLDSTVNLQLDAQHETVDLEGATSANAVIKVNPLAAQWSLGVNDINGNIRQVPIEIAMPGESALLAPTTIFDVLPSTVEVGDFVQFDGRFSGSAAGLATLEFDVDGDGIYEYSCAGDEVITNAVFTEPGIYPVNIRVTDINGFTRIGDPVPLRVIAAQTPGPTVSVTSTSQSVDEYDGVAVATIELSYWPEDGGTVTVDYKTVPLSATDDDFELIESQRVIFVPSEASLEHEIEVEIYQDAYCDSGETFQIVIERAFGADVDEDSVQTVTINGNGDTLPSPVTNLEATIISGTRIDLEWSLVSCATGYNILNSTDGENWTTLDTVGSTVATFSHDNLSAWTQHYYQIETLQNSETPVPSDIVSAWKEPDAPENLVATAISGREIQLAWDDESDFETAYEVQWSADGSNWFELAQLEPNTEEFSHENLLEAKRYYYRVRAVNGSSYSDFSNTDDTWTMLHSPGRLTMSAIAAESITLDWLDISNAETAYAIERSANGGSYAYPVYLSPGTETYQDTGVWESTYFTYRVTAQNSGNFSSDPTLTVSGWTKLMTPTDLVITSATTDAITLGWNDNSNAETSYKVWRSTNGTDWSPDPLATLGSNAETFQDTGLDEGGLYYYKVSAVNSDSFSEFSNVASGSTMLVAPTNLVVTELSSSEIQLTWEDNTTVETSYIIQRSLDQNDWSEADVQVASADAESFVDTTFVDLQHYYYRVLAATEIAISNPSNIDDIQTGFKAPTNLVAYGYSTSVIELNWLDNSFIEDGYKIERSPNGTSWSLLETLSPNETLYQNEGLAESDHYYYRVRAYKDSDYSDYTNANDAWTMLNDPENGLFKRLTLGQFDLSWTDISTHETSYVVERKLSSEDEEGWTEIATLAANAEHHSHSYCFDAETAYDYRVQARNSGTASNYVQLSQHSEALLSFYNSDLGSDASTASDKNVQVATDNEGNWIAVWSARKDINGSGGGENDHEIFYSVSTNNAQTWSAIKFLNSNADEDNSQTYKDDLSPVIKVTQYGEDTIWLVVWYSNFNYDIDGNIATTNDRTTQDEDIFFSYSSDTGETWSPADTLHEEFAIGAKRKNYGPVLDVNPGSNPTWIAVWPSTWKNSTTQSSDNVKVNGASIGAGLLEFDLLYSRGTFNGTDDWTWSFPKPLNSNAVQDNAGFDPNSTNKNDIWPTIASDGAGNWVAAWYEESNQDIFYTRSTNDGVSWSNKAAFLGTPTGDYEGHPEIATDRNGKWVATYTSKTGSGDYDIWTLLSTNAGQTWGSAVNVSNNSTANDFFPHIATDAQGNWVLVWESNHAACGATDSDYDIFLSTSVNNGANWSSPPSNASLLGIFGTTAGNDTFANVVLDDTGDCVYTWQTTRPYGTSESNIGTDGDLIGVTVSPPPVP